MKVTVFKQGTNYYTRMMHNGKRVSRCLDTAEKGIAIQRAKQLKIDMLAGRWEQIEESASRRTCCTISEIAEAYQNAGESRFARHGKPQPQTIEANLGAFSRVTGGIDGRSATLLTKKLLVDYCDSKLRGKTGVELGRARRSAFSALRLARSLFCSWAREAYDEAGLVIPSCVFSEFLKAKPVDGSASKYRVPLEHPELVEHTMKEGRALAETDPSLYIVFVLSYELALRAGESVALKWSWFTEKNGTTYCDIINRPDQPFSCKGTERSVPVHPVTFSAVEKYGDTSSDFVLGLSGHSARSDLIKRKFSKWMRSMGWDRDLFIKTNHELRKLQGSRWFTEVSPQAAQEWLGHADISTTCKFYASLRTQPEPLAPLCL